MGSIISKPKAAAAPVVTTTPQGPTAEEIAAEEAKTRTENILRRARSAMGTVVTGFRGVLSDKADLQPQRKSLLGE